MILFLSPAVSFIASGVRVAWGMLVLARARSKKLKDLRRFQLWKLRKLERQRLLAESWWDPDRAELVALHCYPMHGVSRGEILFDRRGYVNPALESM